MTVLKAHIVFDDEDRSKEIARIHPATKRVVKRVLDKSKHDPDGRSNWMWLRLPNGDLILGVYPQGDTYEECAHDAQFPYCDVPDSLL